MDPCFHPDPHSLPCGLFDTPAPNSSCISLQSYPQSHRVSILALVPCTVHSFQPSACKALHWDLFQYCQDMMPIALSALALSHQASRLREEVPARGQLQAPHVGGDGRIQPGCLVPPVLYEPAFPAQPGLTLQTPPVASWTPPRQRHDRQICGQQGAW